MSGQITDVLCSTCNVPIQGPSSPEPTDLYSCPKCGVSGTHTEVMISVTGYSTEHVGSQVQSMLGNALKGNKSVTFKPTVTPSRNYPFIVKLDD